MAAALPLLQPLLPGLTAVPAIQPGICRGCRTAVPGDYVVCYNCYGQDIQVVPISFSIHLRQLHHHLRNYKDGFHPEVQETLTLRLAALLGVFLANHLNSCLGGPVQHVATVPSSRRDAPWQIIRRLRRFSRQSNPLSYQQDSGLTVTEDVQGQRVLLVDDTFTTGKSLFSAYRTLTEAGATVAGPVVLGRHIRPEWPPSKVLLKRLESTRWDPTRCCRCEGITFDPPLRGDSTSLFGQP